MLDLNGRRRRVQARCAADPTDLDLRLNTSAGPIRRPGGIARVGFTQGAGTLEIKWIPDAHPLPGTQGSGKVIVTFQGLINASQIVSGVSKFIS